LNVFPGLSLAFLFDKPCLWIATSPQKVHTISPVKTMEMDKFFLDMYVQAGGLLPSKFLASRKTNGLIARNIR